MRWAMLRPRKPAASPQMLYVATSVVKDTSRMPMIESAHGRGNIEWPEYATVNPSASLATR